MVINICCIIYNIWLARKACIFENVNQGRLAVVTKDQVPKAEHIYSNTIQRIERAGETWDSHPLGDAFYLGAPTVLVVYEVEACMQEPNMRFIIKGLPRWQLEELMFIIL